MRLQATINGDRTKTDHPAIPITIEELHADIAACIAAGADGFHIHVRDENGHETLMADRVNEVIDVLREDHGISLGLTTGAWILPDVDQRLAEIRQWFAPDYATVNLSEPEWRDVMHALIDAGVGIDAGMNSVDHVRALAPFDRRDAIVRISLEMSGNVERALAEVETMHAALDEEGFTQPRSQSAEGECCWGVLDDALRRGIATRIGFEDTLVLPDGSTARSNADLVAAAIEMRDRQ